ncbi:formate dehydrogenase accessory protein FdhE [Salidesulfovibrio brasiliensis]|uniref:formate dehydrogenase accessory protein FdhE n=1 Tax=Salidesulfovibrio brasiliensis TaxID=221711 RepID=UPI0006D18B64|nr:formate dehydrogenase accessory protein FdhE [Salidesulfovibrio brasiliensis]
MSAPKNTHERLFAEKAEFIRGRDHLPGELMDLLEQVARLQADARKTVSVALPDDDALATPEENLMGKPLLARNEFPYDAKNADALFRDILELLGTQDGPMASAAAVLEKALDEGELETEQAYRSLLNDDGALFEEWAKRTAEAPRALAFLTRSALEPSLTAVSETLAERLASHEGARMSGSCPICGSLPLISRLEGKQGFRFATCSHCRHEYRVRRIACLLCDEGDHEKLTFFTVKEEPGYRVDVCKTCGNYMKTIDFREMDRKVLPILDDLDSLSLDFVARENGYQRATLSAWGF